LLWLRVLTSV